MKKIIRKILCIPFCLVLILIDVLKLPIMVIGVPIWFVLDLIDVLDGQDSKFIGFMKDVSTVGTEMSIELWRGDG